MGLFERKSKNKPKNKASNQKKTTNKKKPIINKKTVKTNKKSVSIGQTLETNDLYLPYKKNQKPKSKSRPVIVADKIKNPSGKEEFAVIPGSTKDTKNTTKYGKYGIDYYRHNIEIEDDEGKPITLNIKFQITKNSTKLPVSEIKKIKNDVINHTKFSSENRKKHSDFQNRHKKSKD